MNWAPSLGEAPNHSVALSCGGEGGPILYDTRLFNRKWRRDAATGCWIWTASTHRGGYGQVIIKRNGRAKNIRAHRLSWMIYRGDIPEDMLVCHRCDVRNCVNPDHLFLGTHADNMRDMARKGKNRAGNKRAAKRRQKLTDEAVMFIRETDISGYRLARIFDVTESHISLIRNGRVRVESA